MRTAKMVALALGALLSSTLAVQAQQRIISSTRARQIALARVPNNQGIMSEKLKTRAGVYIYEIDVQTPGSGHRELRINAYNGAVLSNVFEDDLLGGTVSRVGNTGQDALDRIFGRNEWGRMRPSVSEAQARRIALNSVRNGRNTRVTDVDLERENGILIWEVDVDTPGRGYTEVMVDARSGRVLQQTRRR